MNTYDSTALLKPYYKTLHNEYLGINKFFRPFVGFRGFSILEIRKFVYKEYSVMSREFYPNGWVHGIRLVVYKTPTSVEYYFLSNVNLQQYVSFLIQDPNFKKLVFTMFFIDEIFR